MEVLHPQFALMRGCIDERMQIQLFKAIISMVRTQGKYLKDYGEGKYVKLLSVIVGSGLRYESWDDVPGPGLEALAERLTDLYHKGNREGAGGACISTLRKGDGYRCGMVEVLAFRKDGHLERHIDHVRGAALIISLGCTANFYFRPPKNDADVPCPVRSGDAVMFNSSAAAGVEHGIHSFDVDTKPSWFEFDDFVRVCIQFRQTFEEN